ncbi:unnamed protein product, partial [marine sediment metagenome]
GIEDLKSKNSLVVKFFQRASDDIRKIGIAYVGQNLSKLKDINNFEKVLERLMEFFDFKSSIPLIYIRIISLANNSTE